MKKLVSDWSVHLLTNGQSDEKSDLSFGFLAIDNL